MAFEEFGHEFSQMQIGFVLARPHRSDNYSAFNLQSDHGNLIRTNEIQFLFYPIARLGPDFSICEYVLNI